MPSRLLADKFYNNYMYPQDAPEGTVNVIFIEDNNKLIEVEILIGKAGTTVAAWASVVQDMINYLLAERVSVTKIMEVLSEVHTDKVVRGIDGVKCSSGPEAIYICFCRYSRDKTTEFVETLPKEYIEPMEDQSELL